MNITRVPEDDLIDQIGALQDRIRTAEFPRLVIEEVTDDGETWTALRCPRCGNLVEPDELYAVSPAESWDHAVDIDDDSFDHRRIYFYPPDESPDLEATLYYRHDDHAVSLPEGWREEWG